MVTCTVRSESPALLASRATVSGRRAERRSAMATATKKARTNAVPMEFLIDEDNGGEYHWTLLDRDGIRLARSSSFASYERTEDAARAVLTGAGAARLEPRSGD
jgi:uncharacterized protein YegP (UPF0339 family)